MRINSRTLLAFSHDVTAAAVAWLAAFWLRFNLEVPEQYVSMALRNLVWIVPLHGLVFFGFGLYRGIWRYASLPDLKRIILSVGIAAILVPGLVFMLRADGIPRSVFILNPILLAGLMCGSRLAFRAWKERRFYALTRSGREPVFVLGTGAAAVNLMKELASSAQWRVVGVFDDDTAKVGRQLQGVNVLGRFADLSPRATGENVEQAIIAMPEATHVARRRAMEACRRAGLKVLTVPAFDDLMSGKVTVAQVRHVELDDLLGRDPITLDAGGLRGWLGGSVVMVTGAGGSIGSELCRQIARYKPQRIVMYELNEYALYTIEQEFAARHPEVPVACTIGDVKDAARVEQVVREYRPTVIFHAAAYKHVPLMENHNTWQAVLNNVLGTLVVARAAMSCGTAKFVFVSTDKSVNPTSVMGASKRLAEMVCQALQGVDGTRFVMVRFGNVLGSTGSVIPKFREQIAMGGPVTVTHAEITRYFMSIPEAVQLVMQAGLMGSGGEIFLLDMGEPVKIADLARELIKLSGLSEDDVRIVYTGLRPGEKLYEEPLSGDEDSLPTPHPKLKAARPRQQGNEWLNDLCVWLTRPSSLPDTEVRHALATWVPEYRPQS